MLRLFGSFAVAGLLASTAYAEGAADPPPPADIVVTARKLDEARASIQPSLGATSYGITNATIQALPGGDNQQFNQLVLQLPGVVQDGFGQFHVRGDHGNLQYRINGTVLPEGIAVFGQTLSPRLVEKFDLLTGALPAQYGLRSAGIIDITTKSGLKNAGVVSLYGGSRGMIEPSVEYGGSTGATNYFVSGDYRHSHLGIESVDGTANPLHDRTDQGQAFVYVDHILSDDDRISFVGGYANQLFEIPNPRGLHAAVVGPGYNVGGVTDYRSDDLDERQHEQTAFGQLALLHHGGSLTYQAALFARYSALNFTPDTLGQLLFNGQAQRATKHDMDVGAQFDAAWKVGGGHTIRFGGLASRDRSISRTVSSVFPVDAAGNQTGQPIQIADNGTATETTLSAYLQDEWRLSHTLTFNYGARFDWYRGYRTEHQLSPRANLVWQPTPKTTFHIGYARYFSPPPFENVSAPTVALFAGTSAAAPGTLNTTPFAERQHYFDVGFQQKLAPTLTLSIDGYYRISRNLVDEGQFGAPIILSPFNYRDGRIKGVEANLTYTRGPWLAYANFAVSKATGKDIVSSQFNFDPADLAYIRNHYIYLDHDQRYTGSGGVSYAFREGRLTGLKLGGDMLYGSGLRSAGAVPNGGKLPSYAVVNLSTSYRIAKAGIEVRLDITNLTDKTYEIRDGSGIGVGAPQYGARRGVFVGITKDI
jgi:outer membrane receptor for ferrienterochelin and colicins